MRIILHDNAGAKMTTVKGFDTKPCHLCIKISRYKTTNTGSRQLHLPWHPRKKQQLLQFHITDPPPHTNFVQLSHDISHISLGCQTGSGPNLYPTT